MLLLAFVVYEEMHHSCLGRRVIQFNFLSVPILYSRNQMDTSLGAGGCLLLPQKHCLRFVVAGAIGSVVSSHGDPCLLAAGRRQHLCIRQHTIPGSPAAWEPFRQRGWEQWCVCSNLGTDHPSQGLFACILHLPGVWYGLWETAGTRTAWGE